MDLPQHYGELAAAATAMFWTVTALSFEAASKRIGSLAVNLFRLTFAFVFLSVFNYFHRGFIFPTDASLHSWLWLALSGLVGLVFGDYLLFHSYIIIGSRIAMLVMTLVPPMTALIGWLMLGEKMSGLHILGMFLTMSGIGMAVFYMPEGEGGRKLKLSYPMKGILFALGGAVGQAVGLVLSKYGMQNYDAFSSTQIRVFTGLVGYAIIILVLGKTGLILSGYKDKKGIRATLLGSFFGPFLGISFSLLAVKYTETGIAATIMAVVPILIIPPSIILFKQKFTWLEILGAFISVGGVVLMFL
jgi:drug/metabolite transporter (DMT)-like permease